MAAYAALVSVMHIIEQIQHHPRPPISLAKQQTKSLTENVTFLQAFLEDYSHGGGISEEVLDGLESRIAEAAYAAEDVIESHIADQILAAAASTSDGEGIRATEFDESLRKVVEEMDIIKREVMEIKEKKIVGVQDQLHVSSSVSAESIRSETTTVVGFDDILIEFMDKLVGGAPNRQIIPIVGMGGIGKTTFARNIYQHQLTVQHFDILAWVTISQQYSVREIVLGVLHCQQGNENFSELDEHALGVKLHKRLAGRRYLIILDDVWGIEVWEGIQFFFAENNNGSRIIVTTRLSNLAIQLGGSSRLEMDFLDANNSWKLLREIVLKKERCPRELMRIGWTIARNCKGLPLSIVVIGGLLRKSEVTREYWEHIAKYLHSIVNLEEDERCLKILNMSYKELPVHLKPCFLYMGVFSEDRQVRVSMLIKLWVAEGFLRPIDGKSLEEVARQYLDELIHRNLILVHLVGSSGRTKLCKVHDLFRDLCIREADKKKFLCVIRQPPSLSISQGRITGRRISVHNSTSDNEYLTRVIYALQEVTLARSLIWDFNFGQFESLARYLKWAVKEFLESRGSRLLRMLILDAVAPILTKTLTPWWYFATEESNMYFQDSISNFFNIRYLSYGGMRLSIPRTVCRFWNLQTLVAEQIRETEHLGIWKMPLIRHVQCRRLYLPDPSKDRRVDFVLENLQTLLQVTNFKWGEEVVDRIPNITKLGICFLEFKGECHYRLNNLGRLHKLESLDCVFVEKPIRCDFLQSITFPHALKKLTLQGSYLRWEDMATIGSLPHLQVLKLKSDSFVGLVWETVEGQFCSLRYLLIDSCILEYWNADSTHFPCLERLVLRVLPELSEIPSGIGDIPTLQSIELVGCCHSAIVSAKKIKEEQEDLGNEGLRIYSL